MRAACLCLFALLSAKLPLSAQPWETLRGLKPEDRIKVRAADGTQYKGRFRSLSANAISLETGRGAASVDRTRVSRVEVRSASRRIRRAVIAAAAGLALGATLDQTAGAYFRNEGLETSGQRALTYVVPAALFGAIFAPFPAYRTVYRAPRK